MAKAQELAAVFNVFSVEARVRIVELLKNKSLCVTRLSAYLGISQAATSQHLRILRDAGVVKSVKRGYYVHYYLNRQKLSRINKEVDKLLSSKEK